MGQSQTTPSSWGAGARLRWIQRAVLSTLRVNHEIPARNLATTRSAGVPVVLVAKVPAPGVHYNYGRKSKVKVH